MFASGHIHTLAKAQRVQERAKLRAQWISLDVDMNIEITNYNNLIFIQSQIWQKLAIPKKRHMYQEDSRQLLIQSLIILDSIGSGKNGHA